MKNFSVSSLCLKSNKGFTLLEVIIAIALLIIGLISLMVLVRATISASSVSSSRLLAANLAREGIELVRGIRDTNWLQGQAWDTNIKGTGNERAGIIDYNDFDQLTQYFNPPPADVEACGSACQLYKENNFYSHMATGTAVPFYRLILLDKISPDQLQVTSQVKWIERGRTHILEVVSHLYEWQ